MSGQWLYAAIALVAIGCVNNLYYRILIALCFILLYRHVLARKVRLICSLLIFLMLIFSIPVKTEITEGRIVSMRNGYQIVSNGISRAMIYSKDENVSFDDIVRINCDLHEVNGYDNFEVSTFGSWAKGQNICWQGNIDHYEIIRSEFSLRKVMFEHNRNNGNGWINQLLFGNGMASDSDYSYFLIASGMHVSLLIRWIRSYYGRRYYPLTALIKTIRLTFLLGFIFRFPYAFVRVLINLISELFIDDKRDRTALRAILLALYKPYYVMTVTFLVPVGLSFINLFLERNSRLTARLYILLIQLHFYGYSNLLSTLLFPVARTLSTFSYGLALCCSILPFHLPLESSFLGFVNTLDCLKPLYLNGRIPIVVMMLILKLSVDYVNRGNRKYLIFIVTLLMANHFQSLFNPFYTVEYLDVGQGDCSLITVPFSTTGILIDTGGSPYKDVGSDIVVPFLRARGLTGVEIIVSHDDYDHCGALKSIAAQFPVRNVHYKGPQELVINRLKILSPLYDERFEDVNDDSQLSYFRIGGFGFLYLGDASQNVEEELVRRYQDLDVTVLKVSHHGSYTGTSDKLLATYQVPFAVISAGRSNSYNHPSEVTVSKLQAYGVRILCTRYQHAIGIKVFSDFMIYYDADGLCGLYIDRKTRENILRLWQKMR